MLLKGQKVRIITRPKITSYYYGNDKFDEALFMIGNKIVGKIHYTPYRNLKGYPYNYTNPLNDTLFIGWIEVKQEYRGTGLFSKMLSIIERYARINHFKGISLETGDEIKSNYLNEKKYAHKGFKLHSSYIWQGKNVNIWLKNFFFFGSNI